MIPVFQTDFSPKGDCFRACIASLLEEPLELVPNFWDGAEDSNQMMVNARKFLEENYGLGIMRVALQDDAFIHASKGVYFILGGTSNTHALAHHAVIGQFTETACIHEIVHDPNPNNPGVGIQMAAYFIIPLKYNRPIVFARKRYGALQDGPNGTTLFCLYDEEQHVGRTDLAKLLLVFESIAFARLWFSLNDQMVDQVFRHMIHNQANLN